MVHNTSNSNEEKIDALLNEGLYLFGADKHEEAIRTWQQVLEICPEEPRAIDYLSSAGVEVAAITRRTLQGLPPITQPVEQSPELLKVVPLPDQDPVDSVFLKVVPKQDYEKEKNEQLAAPRSARRTTGQSAYAELTPRPVSQSEPLQSLSPMPSETAHATTKTKRWPIVLLLALAGVAAILFLILTSKSKSDSSAAKVSAKQASAVGEQKPIVIPAVILPKDASTVASSDSSAEALPSSKGEVAAEVDGKSEANFFRVELRVFPAFATIEIDGNVVGQGGLVKRFPLDGKTHELQVWAPGFTKQSLSFVDVSPPAKIRLQAKPKSRKKPRRVKAPTSTVTPKIEAKPTSTPATKPASSSRTDNRDPWK